MSDIANVIAWKFNNQSGMRTDDGVITEFPGGIPSKEDQDTWASEYEAHVAATKYQDDRKPAYPSIQDQLDMQYHDLVDGTTTWKDAVEVVKNKYPKQ
jgi:hypothetical protein